MDSEIVGKLPRAPRLADESYMGYLTAVRNLAINGWFPSIAEDVCATTMAADLPISLTTDDYQKVAPALDSKLSVQAWKRVMRSQQQQTWSSLFAAYNRERDHWLKLLNDAAASYPERLHVDPDFVVPDSACQDIHLQPGGYCRDDLAGFVFYHGTKVFYQGGNDADELHEGYAQGFEPPTDQPVKKILDVGCSIGQCTTALKQRFPDADVWGIDVGLPLLRYAHKRATDMDIDVHFQQALAESLPHDDGSADIVFCYILFHEVPAHTFETIVREAYRVLRPGGQFVVVDAPNGHELPVPNRMWLAFDAQYNCEPYSPAFVATDFVDLVQTCGFEQVEQAPTPTFLSQTIAYKPQAG
ncbi:MAG: class I SAM-dependent methyltransferase [Pseudomonadota bacterium]